MENVLIFVEMESEFLWNVTMEIRGTRTGVIRIVEFRIILHVRRHNIKSRHVSLQDRFGLLSIMLQKLSMTIYLHSTCS